LRQPIESGEIVLHRAYGATRYPARFQLVLAANPCPCGHYFGRGGDCTCTPMARRRYFARLSGPLLDRIDLQVDVLPVRRAQAAPGESSASVAQRVAQARDRARRRWADFPWTASAQVPSRWLRDNTPRSAASVAHAAMERGRLSARGADRALRVAWTLADLDAVAAPTSDHVARAMMLRSRDGVQ